MTSREIAGRAGEAVLLCSHWHIAAFIAICKEGNWPQAAGEKRRFLGISKSFPTLGKNGNSECEP